MDLGGRAYDSKSSAQKARFLVERLWPRGVKKTSLKFESWLKDVAPSTRNCGNGSATIRLNGMNFAVATSMS